MDSKRSFRLILRLFLPSAILLWAIIGLLGWYSISNEREVRRDNIYRQLKNVNATIIDAYDRDEDLQTVANFITFYNSNTTLNDLRISVYDDFGNLEAVIGAPIRLEDDDHRMVPEAIEAERTGEVMSIRPALLDSQESMFSFMVSNDGSIRSIAAIPYSNMVNRALGYDAFIWLLVFSLGFAATALTYALANRSSQSVELLHNFAQKASNGEIEDIDNIKLPKGELGEVSREILQLYRDKDKALQKLNHEHIVAMRATEEKARIKRQTTNNVNHELKTPVSIIKGYLDTILSDPNMPDKMRVSFLEKAQAHADRLTQLLKDVSSITRLDEAAHQIEISNFDFHDLIYSLANDLHVSKLNGDLEFDWDVPFDCMVSGNYSLITGAILNLVKNAAKYSHGTHMSIRLTGEDAEFYHFVFADDGNGVGDEHLPHLFDRFYRVDEGRARKSGGTGLGLPIVKSTFEALGGAIEVHNAQPHGLEFSFKIPKAKKNLNQLTL